MKRTALGSVLVLFLSVAVYYSLLCCPTHAATLQKNAVALIQDNLAG
jgi:hypothetical protein